MGGARTGVWLWLQPKRAAAFTLIGRVRPGIFFTLASAPSPDLPLLFRL
jgi:hypothetical protein